MCVGIGAAIVVARLPNVPPSAAVLTGIGTIASNGSLGKCAAASSYVGRALAQIAMTTSLTVTP